MSNEPSDPPAVTEIALEALEAHRLNSNVMRPQMLDKLTDHIRRTDRYPPIIVRPLSCGDAGDRPSPASHQILDGHHRVAALRRLGRASARCIVWEVDEAEALVLLATLNRLEGADDPRKRGLLVAALGRRQGLAGLARVLPESATQLAALRGLADQAPPPRAPRPMPDMPVAVHFFLLPAQRQVLEARLEAIGGPREDALMRLVEDVAGSG